MGKRVWSLILSIALVGGVFAAVPARAQEAPPVTVPAVVQIEDPLGDANTLGDDQVLAADGGSQTDIEKVWFSHDATNLNVHFLTEGPTTDNSLGFQFVVTAGEAGCLVFDGFYDGLTYASENLGRVLDGCNKLERATGTFTFVEGPDGKGLATITVPRSYSPLFADGSTISGPSAQTWLFAGGEQLTPSTYRGVRQMVDDTKVGSDYSITPPVSGGVGKPVKPAKPTPPGKNDPPGKGKKKGCDNGKGKKKGACPAPKPSSSCPVYVPGEEGTGAGTSIVTDAATADKPVVVEFDSEMGLGAMPIGGTPVPYDETTRFFHNVQVDTASADTGVYARLDFAEHRDYDLYLNYPDGSEGDHSGDFSTIANTAFDCGGTSCESTAHSEAILGLRTSDCGGWTAEMVSFLSEGGPVTLSLWLGEVKADPAPPGGEAEAQEEALSTFFAMTGLVNPSVARSDSSAQASGTPAGNKGCTKGKGKKNGCKKPPVGCAPYAPGELGADQPSVVVTDANTAEAPLLVPISLDPAADEGVLELTGQGETPRAYFNVQVNGAAPTAGLYATFEFQTHRDYDFWAYNPDGSAAASSHGFQPLIDTKGTAADESNTASNHAGESTATSENIVGLITPDCGGYTFEASNYLGEGGDFEIKVWLGEGVTEPGVPE